MADKEKSLWEKLKEDYKFTENKTVKPSNWYQKLKSYLPSFILKLSPVKTITKTHNDWLTAKINGITYDVMMIDFWYVALLKDGKKIFDERRFKDEDFLKLIE